MKTLPPHIHRRGFTLVEISVILVIIALLVAGIVISWDMVRSAELRKQISQVSDYRAAVRNFQDKYGFLPGDLPEPVAVKYNFATGRTEVQGRGDGNGILQDPNGAANATGIYQPNGELSMFWVDLSRSGMISETFNTATVGGTYAGLGSTANWAVYLPKLRASTDSYIYAYSVNDSPTAVHPFPRRTNLLGISSNPNNSSGTVVTSAAFTVNEAYFIDSKIDDGFPMAGNVVATYIGGGTHTLAVSLGSLVNSSISASATTCYDNAANTVVTRYSLTQSGGGGLNCGLSFTLQ